MDAVQLFDRNLLLDVSNFDFKWICDPGDIDLGKLMKYNLRLPRKIRKLLYMYYDLMISPGTIAAQLGVLEGDVEVLVKREVKKMSMLCNPVYIKAHRTELEKYLDRI